MDPRFSRRRVEVRRSEGRRRLRVLVGITAVAAVGCGGWAATGSPLLDVDHVMVEGGVHTSAGAATTAAHLRRGQPMVDVDVTAAVRGVDSLPWVAHATVQRQWPGRVRIRIVERDPVAVAAGDGGGSALVDATGRVLDEVGAPPPGLPVLAGLAPAGPPGTTLSADGMAAVAVAVALPSELRARTTDIGPSGDGEVELRLAPAGTVRLGRPDNLAAKFDAVRAVLAQVDVHNLAVLDVRRPDSPMLTRLDTPTKVSTPRAG